MSDGERYRRLSVGAKQVAHRERMREPAVACPRCDAQTPPADLLRHVETCAGPRDPHPLSRWITWSEALDLGVRPRTLSGWVQRGWVRSRIRARAEGPASRGRPARRVYLLRDVTKRVALRNRFSAGWSTKSRRGEDHG